MDGQSAPDERLSQLAETLGASRSQIFLKFTLPSALPVIFNGLRLGLVFALLGVIGGEIIAFGKDLTILTFFHPNDGERYFWRQASRPR